MKHVWLPMALLTMAGCAAQVGQEDGDRAEPVDVGRLEAALTVDGDVPFNRQNGDSTPLDIHYGSSPANSGHGHYTIIWSTTPRNLCITNVVDAGSSGRDITQTLSGTVTCAPPHTSNVTRNVSNWTGLGFTAAGKAHCVSLDTMCQPGEFVVQTNLHIVQTSYGH